MNPIKTSKRRIEVALGATFILGVAACASDTPDSITLEGGSWQTLSEEQLSADEAAEQASMVDGEVGAAREEEGEVDKALSGCAHISWCNDPPDRGPSGDWGTVCFVTNWNCPHSIVAECTQDAIDVCGGMRQPALIN